MACFMLLHDIVVVLIDANLVAICCDFFDNFLILFFAVVDK